MSLLSRIKALEEGMAKLVPGTVLLTLANGKTLRTTETRLQSIFDEAAALCCPTRNFYDQCNPPHVLTAAEINSVPGLSQLIDVREPLPPVLRSIQQLVRGPLGWHLDAQGREAIIYPTRFGIISRVVFHQPTAFDGAIDARAVTHGAIDGQPCGRN